MLGSSSNVTDPRPAATRWIACAAFALGCAGPTGPAGTPLDCASLESETALFKSELPETVLLDFAFEHADCLTHNRAVLGE